MSTGGDNIQSIDASLTAALSADLALAQSLQAALADAIANPQTTYTVSGPTGSQTFDWLGYKLSLSTMLNDVMKRIQEWFKLKQVNWPYFNVRKGR